MYRTIALTFALLAASTATYAQDHLGFREFRLGMTGEQYFGARHKYQWPRDVNAEKGKPVFTVNGIRVLDIVGNTTDGIIDTFIDPEGNYNPLPKHAKELPIWRLTLTVARPDGEALAQALKDKYDAKCYTYKPGAPHDLPQDWWCRYETADETLFMSAADSSNVEQTAWIQIAMKHPRASLSDL